MALCVCCVGEHPASSRFVCVKKKKTEGARALIGVRQAAGRAPMGWFMLLLLLAAFGSARPARGAPILLKHTVL